MTSNNTNFRGKAPRSGYPESYAKTCNRNEESVEISNLENDLTGIETDNTGKALDKFISKHKSEPKDKRYKCSPGMICGETSSKYFFKMVTCGKDWCTDCGRLYSQTHSRRTIKNYPRVKHILSYSKLQYIIITIPTHIRGIFNSKDCLNDFRTYWRRKLKREGYEKGIMRYHWAGEDGFLFHPHLNILVPGGYIQKKKLAKWRAELAMWFKSYLNISYFPKSNIYSAYTDCEEKAIHWVNYIFRATQTSYNKWTADTINGYRNTSIFGKFPPSDDLEENLLKGVHIDQETGEIEKIRWKMRYSQKRQCLVPQLVSIDSISLESCTLISRGYWTRERILKPPPDRISKIESISGKDFFNFTE